MEFNTLLAEAGIDPKRVVVMRHQPSEPRLRKELRRIAWDDEASLIDYQSSHRPNTEKALASADYIASFLADGSARAIFVGLFKITHREPMISTTWLENPRLKALTDFGSDVLLNRDEVIWFHQQRVPFHDAWKGCLVIAWPPPERSWYRWAHRNRFEVLHIHEEQALIPRLEDWDELVFDWEKLTKLHTRHAHMLESWRGIYLIRDLSDGKAYVGAAYGADNLLGRWREYGRSGHGQNILLRQRDHRNFQFSILERLPETADARQVIERERRWKLRLGTAAPQGLNLN